MSFGQKMKLNEAGVTLIDCDHKTPAAQASGYPYVGIPQLKDGHIRLDGARLISEEDFVLWTKKAKPQLNDVILSRRCNPGESAYVPDSLEIALGQNLVLLRSDGSVIYPPFLRWLVQGNEWWEQVNKFLNVGAVFNSLKCKDIPNFKLTIPSLKEQKRITDILSGLDKKIELNNKINQNLESIAQAIFKSWFIDFEPVRVKIAAKQEGSDPELAAMCVISGKSEVELHQMAEDDFAELQATAALFPDEFVESELGEVPKEWEVKRFEDLLDTLESGTRPKGGVSGISEGMPSVGAENILGLGIYNYGKEKFVPYSFFEKMKKGKVQDYDVLLYKDGGKPGEFKPRVSMFGKGFPYEKFSINEHVFRIRSNKLGQFFLYFKIKSPDILSQLASKGAKAAIPGINQNDVKSLDIIYPNNEVLDKFNFLVLNYVDLILKNSVESKCLAKLRDGLLPKLLSGEIEVENL